MGKNNRYGQSEILSDHELDRIFKTLISRDHKLFFQIGRYSGERFGAICKLKIGDCYDDNCDPLAQITFPANIRKASPNGDRNTRQLAICPRFHDALSAYRPKNCGDRSAWLFPSPIIADRSITWSAADKWLRAAVDRAGLSHRGISGHSLRRSFITKLYETGIDLLIIQQITGHKSLSVLQKYIGISPQKLRDTLGAVFT